MKLIFLVSFSLLFLHSIFAQTNCSQTTLFTEKKCNGDEVNAAEKELFKIINDYRVQNSLPPVALSEPLSLVANRHLIDLNLNLKYLTHGWSNCPYELKNEKTWDCVFTSPQRLGTNYAGQGYENLYRNLNGNAVPSLALEAWKKSPMHNNLILNLEIWKETKYDAFGVAISGNYAAIWFGSTGNSEIDLDKEIKGLGVSFKDVVKGLTTILSIEKEASLVDSEKWVGKSADKSIQIEIYGREKDIAQTTMAFSTKLLKNGDLTPQSRSALGQFLKNVAEKWSDREKWFDAALQKLSKSPKVPQTINVGNRTIEAKVNPNGTLTVLVKPFSKPIAKEL